jgi:hypothetical protein
VSSVVLLMLRVYDCFDRDFVFSCFLVLSVLCIVNIFSRHYIVEEIG